MEVPVRPEMNVGVIVITVSKGILPSYEIVN